MVERWLAGLGRLRALVVGDICLDRWCTYDRRLAVASRETGLARIAVVSLECTPGGGGGVASNLAALGLARVAVLGVAGDDGHGYELDRALQRRGIETAGLVRSPEVSTFTYSKLVDRETGIEDLPRVDFVEAKPMPAPLAARIAGRAVASAAEFDVIIGMDQAETEVGGVFTEAVRNAFAEIGRRDPGRVVWVDSRLRAECFRNVTVKINRSEAEAACLRAFGTVDFGQLRRHIGGPRLFVTDGGNGVWIEDGGGAVHVPTRLVENPIDICGAGDSFSAGAACALALGASAEEAARFGHLIAGITIMKRGTGTASREEIRSVAAASEFQLGAARR
jgi:rfaE bifunctional protein kinase chain/domain